MSYDYNALVAKIIQHRKKNELQEAVDTFSTLSSHCPMTPLLWMQYAHDTASLVESLVSKEEACDLRLTTLELGLVEFPGCALLQLHYLELLTKDVGSNRNGDDNDEKIREAFNVAMESVGRGSHRNEDVLVVQIYNLVANYYSKRNNPPLAVKTYIERSKAPMQSANDAIHSDFESFCQQNRIDPPPEAMQEIESARRQCAKWFDSLSTCEDTVDEAMQTEHILSRYSIDLSNVDWEGLIQRESCNFWMALGGVQTADAIVKYAQVCSRFKIKQRYQDVDDEEYDSQEESIHALALSIYERGIAESPTVESLWLSYMKDLSWLIAKGKKELVPRLHNVSSRAMRNCPYSMALVHQRLGVHCHLSNLNMEVFDPDNLMRVVQEVLDAKFLVSAQQFLDLHLGAIKAMRRRILFLLCPEFDKSVDIKPKSTNLPKGAEEEIQDLVADIRDVYDEILGRLQKHHQKWQEGRALMWKDRAQTETYLLSPFVAVQSGTTVPSADTEQMSSFERLIKAHHPVHPDCYFDFVRMLLKQQPASPSDIAVNFQRVRGIFQKALNSMGRTPKQALYKQRDFETAKHNLCHEYIAFENLFGSEKSFSIATRLVQKKLRRAAQGGSSGQAKREQNNEPQNDETRPAKRQKLADDKAPITDRKIEAMVMEKLEAEQENGEVKEEEKDESECMDLVKDEGGIIKKSGDGDPSAKVAEKPLVHKVKNGKLEYPAHPFTVRVSSLSDEVEDMELVNLFRPKCGAIVHARIIREKHHHAKGKSKGWGLVQFEERESVDKALALHDKVSLRERVVHVQRSNMPAALLTPPGTHKVSNKGEGKFSKRNQKNREKREGSSGTIEATQASQSEKKLAASASSVLAFRPRGVSRKSNKKTKIQLT